MRPICLAEWRLILLMLGAVRVIFMIILHFN
jgi:hypothetical protein